MEIKEKFAVVEDALQTIGVEPETARTEGQGQWMIERGEMEIYIDVWQPQDHNQWEYFKDDKPSAVFQVVVPVCYLPNEKELLADFYEELLYLNHHMFYGSFTVNTEEKMVAIGYKRLLEGCNRVEMIEPIESIGFYAENLSKFLSKKYRLKKVEK
jgi:hypothetical protein